MKTREDYDNFLSDVRKASGVEALTPDESGLVSVRVDDAYNVNLQFVEATGKVLCFVEVKTRGRRGWHRPAEAVNSTKQRNIIRASRGYLRTIGKPKLTCRYDIVEVQFERGRLVEVHHLPGAFVPKKAWGRAGQRTGG